MHHTYIGTEHVLLGLTLVEHAADAQVLAELGVTSEKILAQALPRPCDPPIADCLRLMPRLKRALDIALRLGDRAADGRAGTEHLLAAITQVPDALAIELLAAVGVPASDVHRAVAARLDVSPQSLLLARRRRRRLLAGVDPHARGHRS